MAYKLHIYIYIDIFIYLVHLFIYFYVSIHFILSICLRYSGILHGIYSDILNSI